MKCEHVEQEPVDREKTGPAFRLHVYDGPESATTVIDITESTLDQALEAARTFSHDDEKLWSLELVVGPPGSGLIWLSGCDYHRLPGSASDWRQRKEMQDRYLSARSRRGLAPVLPNGLRVIRLFPEWAEIHPLWESFTDNYPTTGAALGLSTGLSDALYAWNSAWSDRDLDSDLPEGWEDHGWELYTALQSELDGVAEVRPEFGF